MKIAVWDTYVTKIDGNIMHFDIFAPDEINDPEVIYSFGKEYLFTKGQQGSPLSASQCNFCHIDKATPVVEHEINEKGYFIFEMEGCE